MPPSVLRYDPTTADWVVFAPQRAARPHDRRAAAGGEPAGEGQPAGDAAKTCPFCPGNEGMTPPEIYALRDGSAANRPGWRVRVIPNKFPALRIEEDHHRLVDGPLFRRMGGCGAHEVIIESPDHERTLAQQPLGQIQSVFQTLQARYKDLLRDVRFQTVVIFKNSGERAGTSLAHPHFQLIATPVVPRTLRLKHVVATDYFDQTGQCLYCALRDEELAAGERVLVQNQDFVAILPYASHVPFETWILPKAHAASFGEANPSTFGGLAGVVRTVLEKLRVGLDDPHFNLMIDTVSRGDEDKEYFLWHIQILPRLTTPAGFELGSGMSINTVMPEEAASFLRSVEIGQSDG